MITIKQQLLLLEMLWFYISGKKFIDRKEIIKKPIFSNDNDFFKQIKDLKDFGYIKNENYGKNKIHYKLTMNGWAFANILARQNNTEKRFKNISREIIWIP